MDFETNDPNPHPDPHSNWILSRCNKRCYDLVLIGSYVGARQDTSEGNKGNEKVLHFHHQHSILPMPQVYESCLEQAGEEKKLLEQELKKTAGKLVRQDSMLELNISFIIILLL